MALRTSAAPPVVNATASGAVSGLILFLFLTLIERYVFTAHDTARYGLLSMLIGGAVIGAVFGAIVGLVVALTRSLPAGVGVGAVLFAIMKFMIIGVAGGFGVLAIIIGLIYGAVLGWVVATSAVKAL